jgi:transposase
MVTSSTTLTIAEQLVPDEVWSAIQPLLPAKPPHPRGRPSLDRGPSCAGGMIYVLLAGVPWLLPVKELGCGAA